jgi:hypothetical protein
LEWTEIRAKPKERYQQEQRAKRGGINEKKEKEVKDGRRLGVGTGEEKRKVK